MAEQQSGIGAMADMSATAEPSLRIVDPEAALIDLDPDQWARWYDLLLKPNRAESGLYILHDEGRVLTVNPRRGGRVLDIPATIEEPAALAETLYAQWSIGPVMIIERQRWLAWLDRHQRNLAPDDDIISFLLKIKDDLLAEKDHGIVSYPHPFTQWQAISPDMPARLIKVISQDATKASLVLAIYKGLELWTGILIGIEDEQVVLMTTIPLRDEMDIPDWREDRERVLGFAEAQFAPATLGLFCQFDLAQRLGFGPDSWPAWVQALDAGDLFCAPASNARNVLLDINTRL